MKKDGGQHIIAVGAFVMFVVLGLACASTPMITIDLSDRYRGMLQSPVGNERAFDTVRIRGERTFVCRDPQHTVNSGDMLGASYSIPETSGRERHRHEVVFDQLLSEATRHYPTETISLRNARTGGHLPTNARQEEYQHNVRGSDGRWRYETRMRAVWDCYHRYFADIVTTEPMPQPVTHSENFTRPGTRNDIYRWARNWLDDNTQSRRIRVTSEDFDRGRISGTVVSAARADQTYLVTSTYTIDVYDARVEIRSCRTVCWKS